MKIPINLIGFHQILKKYIKLIIKFIKLSIPSIQLQTSFVNTDYDVLHMTVTMWLVSIHFFLWMKKEEHD